MTCLVSFCQLKQERNSLITHVITSYIEIGVWNLMDFGVLPKIYFPRRKKLCLESLCSPALFFVISIPWWLCCGLVGFLIHWSQVFILKWISVISHSVSDAGLNTAFLWKWHQEDLGTQILLVSLATLVGCDKKESLFLQTSSFWYPLVVSMITQQEIVQQEGYQCLIKNLPKIISIPVFHEHLLPCSTQIH